MIPGSLRELHHSARRLRRRPGRSAAGILALALGVGASTAAFSAVDRVLLEPLPVESQDELVVLWQRSPSRGFEHVPFLPVGFDALAGMDGPFQGVAAVPAVGATPTPAQGGDELHVIDHARIAGDFFGVLGVEVAVGRPLTAADDRPGAPPVVVVSHEYWRLGLGASLDAVGSTLRLGSVSYTVVGVAPPDFDYPSGTDAWVTLRGSLPDQAAPAATTYELDAVARLRPGHTLGEATEAVDGLYRENPDLSSLGAELETVGTSFTDVVVGSMRATLWTTLGAGLLLLLVAVADATLLFLAAGAGFLRETATRRALGATGLDVVRPLASDALLQTAIGTALGILLARVALVALVPLAPADLARFEGIRVDWASVAFAASLGGLALAGSAGLAGFWLSRRASRESLAAASPRVATGQDTLRRSLAAAQVSLAVVTAVLAGLLWQTARNLENLDRGFEPDGLYVVSLATPFSFFEPPDGYHAALARVADALRSRPGIEGASPTFSAPLAERGGIDFVPRLEGQSEDEASVNPYVGFDVVSPAYFDIAGTRVLEGRGLGSEDGPDDLAVIVVNEAAAGALWPGQSAIGRRVFMGGLSRNEWRTVVGVVENHRFRTFPEARPAAYVPLAQYDRLAPTRLLVRAERAAGNLRGAVVPVLSEAYSGVEVLTVDDMAEVMRRPMVRPRFVSLVLLSFAVVTLLLAALGIHGVFAVLVGERRREVGIRMALGAATRDVAGFVGSRVILVGASGAAAGALLSLWATRAVESLVFGVESTDPATIVAVAIGAVALSLLAGASPTWSAVRTDPAESLRTE